MTIDRGDTSRIRVSIARAGVAANPDTLALAVVTPAGVRSDYAWPGAPGGITQESTGNFYRDHLMSEAGVYTFQWTATNPVLVEGGTIVVDPSPLDRVGTVRYATVTDLRYALAPGGAADVGTAGALTDGELADAIAEAQQEVDARLSDRGAPFPSAAVPSLVAQITRDLAAFKATLVHRKGNPIDPNDPIRLRYAHALDLLRQIGKGEIDLPGTSDETGPGAAVLLNPYSGDLFVMDDLGLGAPPYGLIR